MKSKTVKKKSPVTIIREQNKHIEKLEKEMEYMYTSRQVQDMKSKYVEEIANIRKQAEEEVKRGNYNNWYAQWFKEAVDIMLWWKDLVLKKQEFMEKNIEINDNDNWNRMRKMY